MTVEKIVAIGAAAVFFALAAIFGLILAAHVRNERFAYAHIDVAPRPGMANVPVASSPNTGMKIVENFGKDGKNTTQVYVAGEALDAPLQSFVTSFNQHIDQMNEQRRNETTTAIRLDVIGLVAALVSGLLELARPFLPRE